MSILTTRREMLGVTMAAVSASNVRLHAQTSSSGEQATGMHLVTSGGDRIDEQFRKLLARSRRLVFIPTAASALRSKYGIIWNPDREENREPFVRELMVRFNAVEVGILHTRSREVADTESFVRALRNADAVWMSGGNAGRLIDACLDTRVVEELRGVVTRGGIVAGESAGPLFKVRTLYAGIQRNRFSWSTDGTADSVSCRMSSSTRI